MGPLRQPSKRYLHSLDAARGLAATAIVCHHVGALAANLNGAGTGGAFFTLADGSFHTFLDFFFVLSGFLAAQRHGEDMGTAGCAGAFLVKRFWRLWPILALLTLAKLLILLSSDAASVRDDLDLELVVGSMLMLPMDRYPLIVAAWTLPFEMTFYALVAFAMIASRRALIVLVVVWSVLIFIYGLWQDGEESFPVAFLLNSYFLEFFCGAALGLWRGWQDFKPSHMVACTALGAAGLVIGMISSSWLTEQLHLIQCLWWTAVYCCLIAGMYRFEILWPAEHGWASRVSPLSLLGRASYSVYLIHGPIVVILVAQADGRGWLANGGAPWALSAIAGAAITVGVLFWRFGEQRINGLIGNQLRAKPIAQPSA